VRLFFPLSALVLTFSCWAASPVIGTSETGPVMEGSAFQTVTSSSQVELENGVSVRFSPRSNGTVFSDHVVLEQGSVRVQNFNSYAVQAHQLAIQAADPAAQAVVRIAANKIEIASLGGSLNVSDGGAMLTRVASGTRLAFQDSGASAQSGAAPAKRRLPSDQHIMYWLIGITGAAALAIGITAAAQGKSPF
jgi:hypothetical protein